MASCKNCGKTETTMTVLCGDCADRMVVLPCKVGDMIWVLFRNGSYFEVGLGSRRVIGFTETSFLTPGEGSFNFSEIGKTVFLTREAAEQALMEAENDKN